MKNSFSTEELQRYGRHLSLPEVGEAGQAKLREGKVLIVGAGGLGCPAAQYLTAAGVGTLGLVEFDKVELSNLQRQILYVTGEVGRLKVEVAREKLGGLNPHVKLNIHPEKLGAANAKQIIEQYDLVLDGTDNFTTRYLINDACVLLGKHDVYGSVFRFEGQVTVFAGQGGPCYRCLHPTPPPAGSVPDCAAGGVLGVVPGLIGVLQATEALKLIMGIGQPLIGRLLLMDVLSGTNHVLKLARNPQCPICGEHPSIRELREEQEICGVGGQESDVAEITADQLRARLAAGEKLKLIDVREPYETALGIIEGAQEIPLGQLEAELDKIESDRPVIVYCQGGTRSKRGAKLLQEHGYKDVLSLTGGMRGWDTVN